VYGRTAKDIRELSIAADEAGFDALWLGEHIVLPLDYRTEHPMIDESGYKHIAGPLLTTETELVDPWTSLGAAAGATTRLRVATGVTVLSLRHPLFTASAAATLNEISNGRFLLGVGVGWLREELRRSEARLKVATVEPSRRLRSSV